jgi:hypothetical protein
MDLNLLLQEIGKFLAPLIEAYGGQYGWAVSAVAIVGTLRLFFKPIMAAIETGVKESETKADDKVLAKVQGNIIYKAFIFLVDLIGSIKIKPKAAVVAPKA